MGRDEEQREKVRWKEDENEDRTKEEETME